MKTTYATKLLAFLESKGGTANCSEISEQLDFGKPGRYSSRHLCPGDVATILSGMERKGLVVKIGVRPSTWRIAGETSPDLLPALLSMRQVCSRIQDAFDRMPKNYAFVLREHLIEGRPLAEIAKRHKVTVARVIVNRRCGMTWLQIQRAQAKSLTSSGSASL